MRKYNTDSRDFKQKLARMPRNALSVDRVDPVDTWTGSTSPPRSRGPGPLHLDDGTRIAASVFTLAAISEAGHIFRLPPSTGRRTSRGPVPAPASAIRQAEMNDIQTLRFRTTSLPACSPFQFRDICESQRFAVNRCDSPSCGPPSPLPSRFLPRPPGLAAGCTGAGFTS